MAAQAEALCRAAADVLRRSNKVQCKLHFVLVEGEGVRQILYSVQLPASTKPQLQAIVLGAQKDEALVWDVAKKSGLMDKIPAAHLMPDDRLLLVLLYEALLGSRRVRGNADIFTFVKDHKAELQRCLAELRKQGTVEKYKEKIRLPRYARINTLKTNIDAVLTHFKGRGWKVDLDKAEVDPSADGSMVSPPRGTIIADPILDDVIVFPAGAPTPLRCAFSYSVLGAQIGAVASRYLAALRPAGLLWRCHPPGPTPISLHRPTTACPVPTSHLVLSGPFVMPVSPRAGADPCLCAGGRRVCSARQQDVAHCDAACARAAGGGGIQRARGCVRARQTPREDAPVPDGEARL
eukprot:3306415-Rhodomonas_salina.1